LLALAWIFVPSSATVPTLTRLPQLAATFGNFEQFWLRKRLILRRRRRRKGV
jgi:hypothetical protein